MTILLNHNFDGSPPTSERDKARELKRMQRLATGLLVLASVIFVIATRFEAQYVWVGFVQAASEAAMVGAIADWFAVTALFRHPLGLKIPHTAILPRRKDSFGEQFGLFVQENFLSETVISTRLQSLNVARWVASWLSQPNNAQAVAQFADVALRGVVEVVNDEDVQTIIEHGLASRIRTIQIAPVFANILELVVSGNRQTELLKTLLKLVSHVLVENKIEIREKIRRETPWWLPRTVDEKIHQRLVALVDETLVDIKANPNHPLHEKFNDTMYDFVYNLKYSPEVIAQGEQLKEEFLQDPVVKEFSSSLWLDIKAALMQHSANPSTDFQGAMQRGVMNFGLSLQQDEVLLAKINLWLEEAARYLIREYGHEVGHLISQTIKDWDSASTVEKIELQVGKDLQFIRINGTLVGGLVGLLLHAFSVLLV